MRMLLVLFVLALALGAQDRTPPAVPSDIAAMHPEGKWTIRKSDLYRYLVRFHGRSRAASSVLEEYMKRRMVEERARARGISVAKRDVEDWLEALDAKVRKQTGGAKGIDDLRKQKEMTMPEFKRRSRQWLLQRALAKAIFNEKDPTRPKDKEISDDSVILVIDTLYQETPKETDPVKLKKGVVARIGAIEITNYEYGRALFYELAATEMQRALADLVLVEATNLMLGEGKPSSDEFMRQKQWFLTFERNRLARQVRNPPDQITEAMIDRVLQGRGLSLELIYENPAFLAQARARGHFRRAQTAEILKQYWEKHRARYGDALKVQRILIASRAQVIPGVGRKTRTLEQGRAQAQAVWIRATGGADFAKLAREGDDIDVIKRNGGTIPILITGATRGYEDTFQAAQALKTGAISKPFFVRGQGYAIVKLLERRKAPELDKIREKVIRDAGEEAYLIWKNTVTRQAIQNPDMRRK